MGLRLRQTWTMLGALAVLGVLGCLGLPALAAAGTVRFRLAVNSAAVSQPLASSFLGLGIEYGEVPMWAGTTPGSVNPVIAQLVSNLDPAGQPILRIGGLSTERTWWPMRGWTRPQGLTFDLTSQWMAQARNLAAATHAQLLPGINLEVNQPRIARVEAQQLVKGLGPDLAGLEIGNEPELYTSIPWYKKLGRALLPWYSPKGTAVFNRRPTYSPTQFLQEFTRTLQVMPAHVPIAGPVTGNPYWLQRFAPQITRASPVKTITWHAYGLNACVTDPRSPVYPSVPNLLSATSSRGFVQGLSGFVNRAHRAGDAFRVDEVGPVTCNGRAGVSNTMASALWAMDALFTMVSDGIDGVNLHTYPGTANALFDSARTGSSFQGFVHPLYYGALMFSQADPVGAQVLRTASNAPATIRTWATRGADHRTRVLVINDSTRDSAQAQISAGGAGGSAAVERLAAPNAYATQNLSLGGVSFPTGTSTGLLPAIKPQAVAARSGSYSVTLAPASAALLTLPAATAPGSSARR